jgi:hypothetical protein
LFSEDELENKKGFMIKLGHDVLKRKEEIENIYKEEDKKKEKLKMEYNSFVEKLESKTLAMRLKIQEEKYLSLGGEFKEFISKGTNDVLESNELRMKEQPKDACQERGKREMPSHQPIELNLKRYSC